MANKAIFVNKTVNAGVMNDLTEHPNPIPNGSKWVITLFGGSVERLNDNFSGNIALRFGTNIIRAYSLLGNSFETDLRAEVVGDGTKKLNVIFQNPSNVDKTFTFWLECHEIE